jgi:hypothetical protein
MNLDIVDVTGVCDVDDLKYTELSRRFTTITKIKTMPITIAIINKNLFLFIITLPCIIYLGI